MASVWRFLLIAMLAGAGLAGLRAGEGDAGAEARPVITGQVTVRRLNVRAGPGTRYEVVFVVDRGRLFRLVAQRDGWCRVAYPEELSVYLPVDAVAGEVGGDIPPEGLPGLMKADTVVRVRPWDKATIVGQVSGGEAVVVLERRGQYFGIKPPAEAFAYVMAQYVNVVAGPDVPLDGRKAPVAPEAPIRPGPPPAPLDRRAPPINELDEEIF